MIKKKEISLFLGLLFFSLFFVNSSLASTNITVSKTNGNQNVDSDLITFNNERYDLDSEFSNNIFTASHTGYYNMAVNITWTTVTDQRRYSIYYYKNNSVIVSRMDSTPSGSGYFNQTLFDRIYLQTGDTIGVMAWDSVGTTDVYSGDTFTFWNIWEDQVNSFDAISMDQSQIDFYTQATASLGFFSQVLYFVITFYIVYLLFHKVIWDGILMKLIDVKKWFKLK